MWWLTDVFRGCCQTTSEIGGSYVVVAVSGVSSAVPERRCGVCILRLRSQPEHFHLCCSVCPAGYFDSILLVLSVLYSKEAVNSLH